MTTIIMQTTLAGLWGFIMSHQTVSALIAAWLGSNFVSALPSPNSSSSTFYQFFFSLTHGLAGSLPRLLPMLRLPSDPSRASTPFYASPVPPPAPTLVPPIPQETTKPPLN